MKKLNKKLVSLLRKKNLKLATAESCTGGMLSSSITSVSGSSKIFIMGLVTYSNKSKNLLLKVPKQILVSNIDGPLKHLKNEWQIREINNQSEVNFKIDFEIENIFYSMIMKKSFDKGLKNIADAFEKRAIQLFKNT